MFREPEKLGNPKPERQPKPKYRKVSKKTIEKMDKKENIKQLINDLDAVFSIFIRQKGMDDHGINFCYSCGKVDHWKSLQCGHYLSRKYYSTRWEEKNCFPQCVKCNIFSEGNKPAFARRLIKDFGVGYLDQLEILKNRIFKLEVFTLQLLIKNYKSKITQFYPSINSWGVNGWTCGTLQRAEEKLNELIEIEKNK